MKKFFIFIANQTSVHFVIKLIVGIHSFYDRYWGFLRFKAFVPMSGKGSFYNSDIQIKYGQNIKIGDFVKIGGGCVLGAMSNIVIGDYVTISKNVTIETAGLDMTTPVPYKHKSKPIIIEDGVWIASNVIILGGVTVGTNSIIGAGVVITKNVTPNTIVVGQGNRFINK
ncbi:acyltransferase [Runella limosa]|uniref:acyltransferase n=1 Tax=Runella limosa TaxID=370978 RepID=UPI0006872085|nr:acyltransferase [Runella limosa]